MPDCERVFHPRVTNTQIWPGPGGYPWAGTGIRCWTREALLRPTGDGALLCTWTVGGFTEPHVGNYTMISRSLDGGATWESAGEFRHPTRGLFTTELFVPRPGEVHAFLQTYGSFAWMCHNRSYRALSRDGGLTWEGPHSIPGGIHNVWVNRGVRHSTGRWVIPVSWPELIGEEWAEPSEGRAPAVGKVGVRPLRQVELPYGADSGLRYSAGNAWADRNHRYCVGVMLSDDEGQSFRLRGYIRGGAHGWLIEPRVVELSDGRLVMLIRSQRDGWLWRSESGDGGESWSPAVRTSIPNPASKVNLLRASDGRIFLLHNPCKHSGALMGGRNPLSLWVSEDDMRTWSVKVDLVRDCNPRASLNYPDGYVDESRGVLHFAWEDALCVYLMTVPMDIS